MTELKFEIYLQRLYKISSVTTTIEQHDLNFEFKQSIPRRSSGALYQKVTTTGSSSASGFRGLLNSLAKPMSVIFSVPFSGPAITEGTVKMSIFSFRTC